MSDRPHVNRRRFISGALASAGLVASGCQRDRPQGRSTPTPGETPVAPPLVSPPANPSPGVPSMPSLPEGLDPSLFHMHTRRPLTLEAKRSSMGQSPITPLSRFFVRNNLPMPDASITARPDLWALEILGVVQPNTLNVGQLKQLPAQTITTVLQCSGNGRKYYEHGPSGSQWGTGAAGCAMWTGVSVATVVQALGGALDDTRFMTSTGGEVLPEGIDPLTAIVERSIPKEKGLQDCLLAWEMNGQPIPITHGGPLRLIVPGYYGCNQIKYIKRLAFTAEQTRSKIQSSGYRLRRIGAKGNPSQPSMWQMNVKSWINGPGADDAPVLAGPVQLHGVAFAGGTPIETVEITLDGGQTWQPARFTGPDLGPYAWRTFAFETQLQPGEHVIASRATDAEGNQQPRRRLENERGYGNNAWGDLALKVKVVKTLPKPVPEPTPSKAPPTAKGHNSSPSSSGKKAKLSAQGERGKVLFTQTAQPSCSVCHSLADAGSKGAVGPDLNDLAPDAQRVVQAVTHGVGTMPAFKGNLSPDQIKDLAQYIVEATSTP